MGKVRTKVIETAIEPEKLKQIEELEKGLEAPATLVEAEKSGSKKKAVRPPKQRSKRYRQLLSLIDKEKLYPATEALEIVKKMTGSFDPTIEVHLNLGVSPQKSEQQIRTHVSLPNAPGKKLRILVFSDKETQELKKLGATLGSESTLKELEKGKVNFDKIIADFSWIPKLVELAKILGPKGLLPNPKNGTLTDTPSAAVKEYSSGRLELQMEKSPIIHTVIGKGSLERQKLLANLEAIVAATRAAKPEGFKKELIKSIYLSATTGPSVKVDPSSI